ncbi:hypothetical protein ACJRO7_019974 [Eucalyptus globulus]|uniref:UBX domain-containing protein n=1 Tax=Eucalyptus globulus TaxID=34317 RepID=A0ABD3KK75_EUCGL
MEPVSPPPRLICCFSFMPAKDERRKRRGKGVSRSDLESQSWGKNEDMLSDVSTFSVQEQERRLKIAREEEDRARREAEKVDMWVRQESARMKVSIPEEKDAKFSYRKLLRMVNHEFPDLPDSIPVFRFQDNIMARENNVFLKDQCRSLYPWRHFYLCDDLGFFPS